MDRRAEHWKLFWESYAENHFWRLNDKTKVRENSVYYDGIYDRFMPANKDIAIVDVGCGGGHFLHYLARRGFRNAVGIDLSPGLVKFIHGELGLNAVQGDALEYLRSREGHLDLIAANDFLEHLRKEDVIEFLFLAKEALKPGGRLLLKVPNMCNPFAPRNRYVDFTHEVGFTEHSLFEVAAAAGFSEIGIFSDFPGGQEPPAYAQVRSQYAAVGESQPRHLSTNLVAVCVR